MDVARVFEIALEPSDPNSPDSITSEKPMMALSGVLQLVRHVGQEFGLGAVGGLGALGLAHVFLVEVDELLAALLLGAPRQAEVVDRRHQPPLAVDQLLLVLLSCVMSVPIETVPPSRVFSSLTCSQRPSASCRS